MADYKSAKEAFHADNPGSSVHRINAISITALTAYALYARLSTSRPRPVLDWAVVVLPLLLAVTALSSTRAALAFNVVLAAVALVVRPQARPPSAPKRKDTGAWLAESSDDEDADLPSPRVVDAGPRRRPAVTVKLPSQIVAEDRAASGQGEPDSAATATASGVSLSPLSPVPPISPFAEGSRPPSASSLLSPDTPERDRRRRSLTPNAEVTIDFAADPQAGTNTTSEKSVAPTTPGGTYHPQSPSPAPPAGRTAHLPFLSVYRAHMMIMTVMCILAVDFSIFPRVLGKCEDFGTSLMDVGVGSFVFSLGIVSGKNFSPGAARRGRMLRTLLSAMRRAAPVLILGFIRLLMVKGVEYPEHVTEYGVHWNFFFTLGLVPALATALLPLRRVVRWSTLGVTFAVAYQLVLSLTPLQSFLLSPARPGLLGANKEGLASLPGYLAIFLVGLSCGEQVLRASGRHTRTPSAHGDDVVPDPVRAAELAHKRKTELALELAGWAGLAWGMYGVASLVGLAVSRRFANLPYVLWTVAYNTSYLAGYAWVELLVAPTVPCPPLLAAVNNNGLVVFLAANLLTGLVNISMQTMYASDAVALAVIAAYLAATCGLAWAIRDYRLKI